MSHKSLRLLVESTVKSLHDSIQYSYGEESTFAQSEHKDFILVNVTLMPSTGVFAVNENFNLSKTWTINIAWYKYDTLDSVDYYKIHDELDPLCDRFVNLLNQRDDLTITAFNQQPFVKVTDILTGYLQTVTVRLMDDFEYCHDC